MASRRMVQRVVGIAGVVTVLTAVGWRAWPVERPVVPPARTVTPAKRPTLLAIPSVRPLRFSAEAPTRQRDVFAFRPAPVAAASAAQPIADLGASGEPLPVLPTLIGIAEETRRDGVVRTAIVSAANEVQFLKTGQAIGSDWTVTDVTGDSVELTRTSTGTAERLVLP